MLLSQYSHHIIAESKRAAICALAKHLQITGMVKVGWPGAIICEGDERNVQNFVSCLQGWRWKQLTVRGEEVLDVSGGLDELRAFDGWLGETTEMRVIADACRERGVEALFLTLMKIYR